MRRSRRILASIIGLGMVVTGGAFAAPPQADPGPATLSEHSPPAARRGCPPGGPLLQRRAGGAPAPPAFAGRTRFFREPVPPRGAAAHDGAALVGSSLSPDRHRLGPAMRGPQDPAVVCPASDPAPPRCDDGPYGKGTGGELTYTLDLSRQRTVWFAVAGSDKGLRPAYDELSKALRDPAGALARKTAVRADVASRTRVDLPGDPLLARTVERSKEH